MISLIYGSKGSGKTKRIIDSANDALESAKGSIIYITDKPKHSKELNYKIRFFDTSEYQINSTAELIGFIKGALASDNDIEKVYIDGLARMAGKEIEKTRPIYTKLKQLAKKDSVEFILTASCDQLPAFLKSLPSVKAEG